MTNFNLSRTLVENINDQNDKINNCIDIVNGLANDEEIKVIQELRINEELTLLSVVSFVTLVKYSSRLFILC